jgi:nucleotide-binding universal stress UspA family protein
MFQHILIPTDGSQLSQEAVKCGIEMAKRLGARVTGFVAIPEHPRIAHWKFPEAISDEHARLHWQQHAKTILGFVEKQSQNLGVPCDTVYQADDEPYRGILRTAEAHGCDLIFMASHGRRGMEALLLGSETQKVLAHSRIPVLVYRSVSE